MSVPCICWNYFLWQEHVTVLSVTVSGADHRTVQWAGDEPRQPGALTIIPKPLVAALLEADYPALQEKSPLLHGLPSTETVFGSKSKCRLLQHREQSQGSPMPGGFIFLRFP